MKKIIQAIICLLIAAMATINATAQVTVGLRDSRYVYADYEFKNHIDIKLEHSIYSEKFKFQLIKLYAGYNNSYKSLTYGGDAFYGRTYKGNYYTLGAHVFGEYSIIPVLALRATIAPIYDSGYDYKTCFEVQPIVALTKEISVHAAYTTIPEYREYENRVRGGFTFKVGKLTATPAISIPVSGNNKYKSLRVLASMAYTF
jgi:uncharacterized membrane protein